MRQIHQNLKQLSDTKSRYKTIKTLLKLKMPQSSVLKTLF